MNQLSISFHLTNASSRNKVISSEDCCALASIALLDSLHTLLPSFLLSSKANEAFSPFLLSSLSYNTVRELAAQYLFLLAPIMQFGAFFSAVGACKKAADVIKDVNGVPDNALHLWRLCDSLQPSLSLLMALNSRSLTCEASAPALAFAHEVLSACEVVLVRSQPDGRPFEAESWAEWWSKVPANTRDSICRVQLLPQLIAKVVQCVAVLQLALQSCSALASCVGGAASVGLHKPLASPSFEGLVSARRILHLLEMGRLDASVPAGDKGYESLYQLGQGRVFNGSRLVGTNCAFILARTRVYKGLRVPKYFVQIVDVDDLSALRGVDGGAENSRHTTGYTIIDGPTEGDEPPSDGDDDRSDGEGSARFVRALRTVPIVPKTRSVCAVGVVSEGSVVDSYSKGSPSASGWARRKVILSIASSAANSLLLEFQSCSVAGQFCYFPLGNESYQTVTAETFVAILFLISTMSGAAKGQVDEIWPNCSEEDEDGICKWAATSERA